ncbi:YcxB family protein [Bacillus alkalisoli]|uniref:YcxB family protein n=1 Tax=Bacillus alkalisoli TaxID=2011008 RepID=UPI000C24612F|nr:YcxB family protein [Bacillus alkalisoli]
MDIRYNLTEDDFLHFNLFHLQNSQTAKKSLMLQRFVSPLFFLGFSYVFSVILDVPFLAMFIPFFILSIVWILFYPKYFYSHVIRNVKKMIKEGKNEGLLGNHVFSLNEDGFSEETSSGETKVKWSGVNEFKEDDKFFYIYNSSVSAYILPKETL